MYVTSPHSQYRDKQTRTIVGAKSGFTLIELMVAVSLFAVVMMLASGAYLVMISVSRQAQGIATGTNNISFALESMTRAIENGTGYGGNSSSFTFTSASGASVTYTRSALSSQCDGNTSGCIIKKSGATSVPLTGPSVEITSLTFTTTGQSPGLSDGQPHVTIVIFGKVLIGHGKSRSFTLESGATMRSIDL